MTTAGQDRILIAFSLLSMRRLLAPLALLVFVAAGCDSGGASAEGFEVTVDGDIVARAEGSRVGVTIDDDPDGPFDSYTVELAGQNFRLDFLIPGVIASRTHRTSRVSGLVDVQALAFVGRGEDAKLFLMSDGTLNVQVDGDRVTGTFAMDGFGGSPSSDSETEVIAINGTFRFER